jgi:hypothetical protein
LLSHGRDFCIVHPFRQQQIGIRATRKNGLKIRGSGWIPVGFRSAKKKSNIFNGL